MHGDSLLEQALIYLAAAVLSVPLAKRLGLGSVLGYLIAGAIVGPSLLGLVGEDQEDVMHFAEFGVVMMLFLIGLELKPALLWRMRGPILGLGGAQVGGTTLAVAGVALLFGLPWQSSLAVGLVLSLSSTAIALQTLQEKGLTKTNAGQSAFSTLLFQDIAVIPILTVLPLLAIASPEIQQTVSDDSHGHGGGLPAWQQGLLVVAVVVGLIGFGRFLSGPIFRFVAGAKLREAFTATALLIVVGIALIAQSIGLSAALGTFLAGVVLAESEFRHELESDIEPFKGLLLGLFFLSVGASIDFDLLMESPLLIMGLSLGLVVIKLVLLVGLGKGSGLSFSQNATYSFSLAQGGEFAFVLFSFAQQNAVLSAEITSPLVAAVAFSMMATPLLMIVNEKFIQPRAAAESEEREPDAIEGVSGNVVIAGFGRFGHVVGRMLRANGAQLTVLDSDPEQVEMLRRLGLQTFYGDASRLALLEASGLEEAQLFVLAVDEEATSIQIAETVKKHFPEVPIYARAIGRVHAYELLSLGVEHIYRETLDSSLVMSSDLLRALGMRAFQAKRLSQMFKQYDETTLRKMVRYWQEKDKEAYLKRAKQEIENIETILSEDSAQLKHDDGAWDSSQLIADANKR